MPKTHPKCDSGFLLSSHKPSKPVAANLGILQAVKPYLPSTP